MEPAKKNENWKAVHLSIHMLMIGSFKVEAKYALDLVAKFYYSRRKLVWEILHNGLKNKIEIQWKDILAIRAITEANKPGIFEIELDKVPLFFRETKLDAKRHTKWDISEDFTAGQASTHRRHYVQFNPGVLDQCYKKLLQCDNQLLELSREPFPKLQSPYFDSHLDQRTSHFSNGHALHAHGSKTTSVSEQQSILKPHVPPIQQVQQFGNTMPLSPIGNDPNSSTLDIFFHTNEAINNQIPQDLSLDAWNQGLYYGTLFSTESMPTSFASEQPPSLEPLVVPTQQVRLFSNTMTLSPDAINNPISPTSGIFSPTNEAISNQILQDPSLNNWRQGLHNEQTQLFSNTMPLSLNAIDNPISQTSDIWYPTNEAINNEMLQDPKLAAWSQGLCHGTSFSTEFVPCTSNLERTRPVSNFELNCDINGMLPTCFNIPETVFDARHMGIGAKSMNAIAGQSMEAGPAYNTNTNTQIYQPNSSKSTWNALPNGSDFRAMQYGGDFTYPRLADFGAAICGANNLQGNKSLKSLMKVHLW